MPPPVKWVLFFALFYGEKAKFREVQKLGTGAAIDGTETQTLAGVRACVPAHPPAARSSGE